MTSATVAGARYRCARGARAATEAAAQARAVVIRNATIVPVTGRGSERARSCLRGGRIEAVGANVAVPSDAT